MNTKYLADLYLDRKPGCCIICDQPLKPKTDPGRKPAMCGEACRTVYRKLNRSAIRAEVKRKPMPADAVPAPGELSDA